MPAANPPHIEEFIDFHDDWLDNADRARRLEPQGVTFTDRRRGKWRVSLLWGTVDGRAEPVALTLWSMDSDPRAVTKETLRDMPLGEMVAKMRADVAKRGLASPETPADARRRAEFGARRGVALSADGLQAVADAYIAAWQSGEPVQEAVAKAFNIAKGTAANRIMQARRAGLLPPSTRGRQPAGRRAN